MTKPNHEQEQEIYRCATDFPYFCEAYVKVIRYRGGNSEVVPFLLYPYQEDYYDHVESNRFTILSKFRQGGFTTLAAIYGLWRCLFRCDQRILWFAKSDREATTVCEDIVKRALTYMPDWMTGNVLKMSNSHRKEFPETGSRMSFMTAEPACGQAMSLLIVDEASYIPDMDKHWRAIWPVLSTGGSCIVQSTANCTEDWFWETLTDAKLKLNKWSVYGCQYTDHPEYADAQWQATMKQQLGPKGWDVEMEQHAYDLTHQQEPVKKTPQRVWRSIYDDWRSDEEGTISPLGEQGR